MKNIHKKIILILATYLQEEHPMETVGLLPEEIEKVNDIFSSTPRIESSISSLIAHYLKFNKYNLLEQSEIEPIMSYDRMIIPLKATHKSIIDKEQITYKTLRSIITNHLESFEELVGQGTLPISKNVAVCILPVLLNRELYDLSQKMMYEYQNRNDKSQDYYKFTEFFNSNRKKFFYTVYLTQNHII